MILHSFSITIEQGTAIQKGRLTKLDFALIQLPEKEGSRNMILDQPLIRVEEEKATRRGR